MTNKEKYYEILQLNHSATRKDIKKAYRELAKKWHPDKYADDQEYCKKAQEQFILITEAYEKLINDSENEESVSFTNIKVNVNDKNDQAQTYYNLGVYAYENDEWKEAIDYFSQAIKINNSFAEAYFYRGTILEKQNYLIRAEADFNKFKQLKQERLSKIWQDVINNLQQVISQQICQQGLQLISFNKNIACLAVKNHNQLLLVESKISDFQQAFNKVCGVNVTIQLKHNLTKNKNNHRSKFNYQNNKSKNSYKSRQQITVIFFILLTLVVAYFLALTNNRKITVDENKIIQQQ
jgi:curved DNA-binding protein CbpA